MSLVLFVNMSVCLCVCPPDYSKSNEPICIKISPGVFWAHDYDADAGSAVRLDTVICSEILKAV